MTDNRVLPSRLGHYDVEAQLGAGGMGVVYRAFDTRLHRRVAIKVFPDFAADAHARDRLLHEARNASALHHPNICMVFEVGESDAAAYLVMEYVEGEPLAARIPAGGLPLESIARYGAQIAAAVAHAHGRGVIHRDLKTANVVITPGGEAKVLDFGVAVRHSTSDALTREATLRTSATGVAGTVAYMAPEALRGAAPDARADVWSLAVMLYEMACGRLPFTGSTVFDVSARILGEPPAQLPTAVLPALRALIERGLVKDPGQRIGSADEVRQALQSIESGTPAAVATATHAVRARRSVLVLPFSNIAADADTDFFAAGLADEVIADLSKIRSLRVISRTSSVQLKEGTHSFADLAARLHVEYVLEGSVRRSGRQLRVTTQLIDIASDSPVWSEKYSGDLEDVFTIQETISRSIAAALRVTLSAEENARLSEHPLRDARAYEWYLRARQEMMRFSKEGLERSLECLDKSAAIEGETAALVAARGHVYWQFVNAGVATDQAYLERAAHCARHVLAIDPASTAGHRLLGLVSIHMGDMPGALRQLRRAIGADTTDPESLFWGSIVAALSGQGEPARLWSEALVEIDPLTPFYQVLPGLVALMRGDFGDAADVYERHQAAVRELPLMRVLYGQALAMSGRTEAALAELEDLASTAADDPFGHIGAMYAHALRGRADDVRAAATALALEVAGSDPQYAWFVAQCYSLIGDSDTGLQWLDTAISKGLINYPLIATLDPFLASLRDDARFAALAGDVERQWRALGSPA